MIKPTVGRVVWYRPSEHDRVRMEVRDSQPLAAVVAYVWSPALVNLTVFDHNGVPHQQTSVVLHQDDSECTASPFCEWIKAAEFARREPARLA